MAINVIDVLSESDFLLVRDTSLAELRDLDEDALLELHTRVRRARNKHVGIYRRAAAARVQRKGARGAARDGNQRNAARVEIFEDALARVSRQLAVVARQSARELKAERLALAKSKDAVKVSAPAKSTRKTPAKKRVHADKTRKNPGRIKREAGTKATGARRQAKRDAR